jgi:hypothetical protein
MVRASSRRLQDPRHGRGDAGPLLLFRGEAALSRGRDPVVAGAPVVVGRLPLRVDEPVPLQALERGIERAQGDLEDAGGGLLDPPGDAVAVVGDEVERLQDQQVQLLGGQGLLLSISIGRYPSPGLLSTSFARAREYTGRKLSIPDTVNRRTGEMR